MGIHSTVFNELEASRGAGTVLTAAAKQDLWLRVGATEKAESIVHLTSGLAIHDLMEIGCGSGAILAELDRREFAENYFACEPSNALYEELMRKPISRLRSAVCAPLTPDLFGGRRFDLIVLSHVLEHIISPSQLLAAALDRAEFVVIELPIEAGLLGNVRAGLRSLITGKARTSNAAGHVQFFSLAGARELARWAGAEVLKTRLYSPVASLRVQAGRGSRLERLIRKLMFAAEAIVGHKTWARMYYGHYALLLQKRKARDIADWSHKLYANPDL